jgi:hypothetical protein
MGRQLKKLLLILIYTSLFVACKKENMCDCLKSTGSIEKEQRTVSDFTMIEVHKNIYVTLIQDTINSVEVEAGKHLLPLIKTEVTDGTLYITNDNKCNWVRSYSIEINVYIHVKNLEELRSYSSKNIHSANTITTTVINIYDFNSGDISLDISSNESYTKQMGAAGDIKVTGNTNFNYVFDQGYGFLHLENLQSNSALIVQHGTGDIYIQTKDALDVEITDVGNVYYSGNPVISQRPSVGSGKLIHD